MYTQLTMISRTIFFLLPFVSCPQVLPRLIPPPMPHHHHDHGHEKDSDEYDVASDEEYNAWGSKREVKKLRKALTRLFS